MAQKIEFIARDEYCWEVCPRPFPARSGLPDWWTSMSPYQPSPSDPKGKKLNVDYGESNATFKKCVPMLDALTSGYIVPLWSDVQLVSTETEVQMNWRVRQKDVFSHRGESASTVEAPSGYSSIVFKYQNGWMIKTPPGYSTLVTAPFGYRNLPFMAIPAIIDTDKYYMDVIPPVWVRQNFDGIVEKGTPILQLTPFKRVNWESTYTHLPNNTQYYTEEKNFRSIIKNHYLKNIWSKKEYK
jgi:hypothetical protein